MIIYLAGPIRPKGDQTLEGNINNAKSIALELWKKDYTVISPHANSDLPITLADKEVEAWRWLNGDLDIIARCDAVVVLPSWEESAGTKGEIEFAKERLAIPFAVFKPTGFGRLDLYTEVTAGKELTNSEKEEWQRVRTRYEEVCQLAFEKNVILMVDAEETWMQGAVDDLVNEMMEKYNKEKAIIWNTIQMYRTGRIEYLKADLERAISKNYFLGYKFVRGAYMEKERERAAEMNYPDPIQPTKEATDDNYNAAVDFVLENLDRVAAFFGTHNEKSTELAIDKMKTLGLAHDDERLHFGQLYGMSDNITYWLGENKYNACKYLPYGPVKDVVPYLTRRAQENTSVAGQTGRELSLIQKELERRRKEK